MHDTLEAISDHCLISMEFYLPGAWKGSIPTDSNAIEIPPKLRIKWDDAAKEIFCAELESAVLKSEIKHCLDSSLLDTDMNACINDVQNILLGAAQKIGNCYKGKLRSKDDRRGGKPSQKMQKKWFDADCLSLKRSLAKMSKQLVQSPNKAALRVAFHAQKKFYKKTLKMKERAFRQSLVNKLNDLSENNPRAYWKVVDELRNATSTKAQSSTSNVPLEEWQQHYENLLASLPHLTLNLRLKSSLLKKSLFSQCLMQE